ncbi:MAG: hypothetical protein A3E01_02620 [Gammaproteobacteria bacterium RIFCSPHIGHO2_12_FULL_63_22]|nr:MAG: hypothetical protein A3E01_02620 [Gammaproteobacteria bacterium RIFCSPHIGHO2_12_FULL_63_22]
MKLESKWGESGPLRPNEVESVEVDLTIEYGCTGSCEMSFIYVYGCDVFGAVILGRTIDFWWPPELGGEW